MRPGSDRFALVLLLTAVLAGCSTTPTRSAKDGFPAPGSIPPDLAATPNAVPRTEPRSAHGNPASYEVFGKVYHVRAHARGYDRIGYASWYGIEFQGQPTASGEPYDMFKMTAASRTLPIPSFARVTDLASHKSVIVRINDRGPFHPGRIIDLSYVAALKLGILGPGSALVRVKAITPAAPDKAPFAVQTAVRKHPPRSSTPSLTPGSGLPLGRGAALYLQVGVFRYPTDAASMKKRLEHAGYGPVTLRHVNEGRHSLTDVELGPFANSDVLEEVRHKLHSLQLASIPVRQ